LCRFRSWPPRLSPPPPRLEDAEDDTDEEEELLLLLLLLLPLLLRLPSLSLPLGGGGWGGFGRWMDRWMDGWIRSTESTASTPPRPC
jgi:hypothetical protein